MVPLYERCLCYKNTLTNSQNDCTQFFSLTNIVYVISPVGIIYDDENITIFPQTTMWKYTNILEIMK